jgi:hypothetical protein
MDRPRFLPVTATEIQALGDSSYDFKGLDRVKAMEDYLFEEDTADCGERGIPIEQSNDSLDSQELLDVLIDELNSLPKSSKSKISIIIPGEPVRLNLSDVKQIKLRYVALPLVCLVFYRGLYHSLHPFFQCDKGHAAR